MKKNPSFWEIDALLPVSDLIVIGSGLTGLGAALHWKRQRPHDRVVVLDRGLLPSGASTKNAGFACFGSPSELLDDLHSRPVTEVWDLVARRWEGLQYLRELLGDEILDFQQQGGYEMFTQAQENLYRECLEALPVFNDELRRITGVKEVFQPVDDKIRSFGFRKVIHLLANPLEGQLHPGKMIRGLQQKAEEAGVVMLTGAEVTRMEEQNEQVSLYTAQEEVLSARRVLVATNGFARRLIPELSVEPARNQVVLTAPIPGLKVKGTYHYDRGYYYFRDFNGRLLIGGGRNLHPTQEQTDTFGLTENIIGPLEDLIRTTILPETAFRVEYKWSGIMGVGPQKQPIFRWNGKYSFLAVRLGGMGVALGARLGRDAAEELLRSY